MTSKELKEKIITSKICYDEGIAEKWEWFNLYWYTETEDREEVYSNISFRSEDHRDWASKINQGINIKKLKLSIKLLNFVNYDKIQVKFYHNYKSYDYVWEEDDSFDISKKDLIKILKKIINFETFKYQ